MSLFLRLMHGKWIIPDLAVSGSALQTEVPALEHGQVCTFHCLSCRGSCRGSSPKDRASIHRVKGAYGESRVGEWSLGGLLIRANYLVHKLGVGGLAVFLAFMNL